MRLKCFRTELESAFRYFKKEERFEKVLIKVKSEREDFSVVMR